MALGFPRSLTSELPRIVDDGSGQDVLLHHLAANRPCLAANGICTSPTTEVLEAAARDARLAVTVVPRLCQGAFDALEHGDGARHDAIVAEELDRLAAQVDVVVLAQASMARIAAGRPEDGTRVLSSPRLAMERLAELGAATGTA